MIETTIFNDRDKNSRAKELDLLSPWIPGKIPTKWKHLNALYFKVFTIKVTQKREEKPHSV